MTPDEPLFAAFAMAVCQAVVSNLIEMRAALSVLVQRRLLSGDEIESAKQQAPPELVQRLTQEIYTEVMSAMHEQYRILRGPIQ